MTNTGSDGSSAAKPRSHSSLFLTGEADPNAMKRREERLGGMLSGAVSTGNSKSTPSFSIGGDGIGSSGGGASSLARPKIQVVSESKGGGTAADATSGVQLDSDDEDDAPPPISVASSRDDDISKLSTSKNDAPTDTEDGPSLMETMMAEAAKARADKEAKAKAQQRKEAKSKSSFGSMKGGFLNSKPKKKKGKMQRAATTSTSTTSGTSSNKTTEEDDNIFELDSEGNMVKSVGTAKEEIPTIRPKNGSSGTRSESDRLRLQEVQDAMKNSSLGGMFGGNGGGTASILTDDAELMQKIASNPRLAAGMRNPKFGAAMEAMQRDPVAAIERFRDHPEIGHFLSEYCGVLGDHFTELGEKQEKEAAKARAKKGEGAGGDMGPLAEAALRRDQERKARGEAEAPMSQSEEEMMQKIVADPEMAQILMDPAMQIIMQECALPGRMHAYMNHPDYGPKLRKLVQVGLLKVG